MKKKVTIRISKDLYDLIETYSNQTGISKTDIFEKALRMFFEKSKRDEKQIELYEKENQQLKMLIKVLEERKKALEKVEGTYQKLLDEKDQRIQELKEIIEVLKQGQGKKKPFWKFWD